jgi:hypothetical protein
MFAPIRAGGARYRLRRGLRRRRRAVAVGLAMTAAALAAAVPGGETVHGAPADRVPAAAAVAARPPGAGGSQVRPGRAAGTVRAPVRIADAGAVRLLRPGDRVDVLAAARVVAAGAPVVSIPDPDPGAWAAGDAADTGGVGGMGGVGGVGPEQGALVVLAVPRATAAALAGAAAQTPLAVTLR